METRNICELFLQLRYMHHIFLSNTKKKNLNVYIFSKCQKIYEIFFKIKRKRNVCLFQDCLSAILLWLFEMSWIFWWFLHFAKHKNKRKMTKNPKKSKKKHNVFSFFRSAWTQIRLCWQTIRNLISFMFLSTHQRRLTILHHPRSTPELETLVNYVALIHLSSNNQRLK